MKFSCISALLLLAISRVIAAPAAREGDAGQSMDKMWGESTAVAGVEKSDHAAMFRDGNYGMFIHWGLFSHLGGQWKDQTFYGIGEWIKRQMRISDPEYFALAREFNPVNFNAREIARLAKAAGMKYIIITSKHHEGFAMFKSAHPFNIVDATPFKRDPMKELAAACKEAGLGFGFYYSHNQDWTAPGGTGGPSKNPDGTPASFEQYFREKCQPQVKEICTNYGPLNFIWFDTPGNMPKELVVELAQLVRTTQPKALLCSRIGHGMGDYASKGDMEVPPRNIEGLWETCDTTNDSWSYAWYDQNWKDSREILHRLVSTVGRGGTYLLNIGIDGKGNVPPQAAKYLEKAGQWIQRNPQVIYSAGPSPWGSALAWGDVTTQGSILQLVVFDWPSDGRLYLPGLQSEVSSIGLRQKDSKAVTPLQYSKLGSWTVIELPSIPAAAPDQPASVIEVRLKTPAKVDPTAGVYPNHTSTLQAEFAEVQGAKKSRLSWMEKFGEWKFATQVGGWTPQGTATWTVNVAVPGDYHLALSYRGAGPTAWRISTDEDVKLQNRQNGTGVYQSYPFGILTFKKPGQHTITVSHAGGNPQKASLQSISLTPAE